MFDFTDSKIKRKFDEIVDSFDNADGKFKKSFNDIFDNDIFGRWKSKTTSENEDNKWYSTVEGEGILVIEFLLPGFEKNQIDLKMHGKNELVLFAERSKVDRYSERSVITRKCTCDVTGYALKGAQLRNGVLRVEMNKREDTVDINID